MIQFMSGALTLGFVVRLSPAGGRVRADPRRDRRQERVAPAAMSAARWALGSLVAAATACASPLPPPAGPLADGLLPGTLGIVVKRAPAGVVVEAVKNRSAEGLKTGDVVMRYNGIRVTGERQLYELILNSLPGSVAELEVLRAGKPQRIAAPVEKIDTALRV